MRRFAGLALVLALVSAAGTASFAATAKKAPAKKATKPAAKAGSTTPHVVQGTTQLKGEYAQLGQTYTLGKDSPLNVCLKSAEFSVAPVKIGESLFVPTAEEKLLILHFVYHNPQKSEKFLRWDTLDYTVVDSKNQNHDGLKDLGMEKDQQSCSMSLKPAQKIEAYGVMLVPADGEMPKLILKSSDELVLRYDLKGKVKGLAAPFADTKDATGATALDKISAQMGTYYPLGTFSMKINNVEYSDSTTMGEVEAEEGEKLLVVSMDIKNEAASKEFLRWDTFESKIMDVDDTEVADCDEMFQKSKDRSVSMDVEPGQEITVRCAFKIPADTELKTFSTKQGEGRTFVFDISGVK